MSIARVVLAVGGPGSPLAALAARLASRLEAELLGLFVEDENWFRMAALPFTRVAGPGPLSEVIDPEVLARALRAGFADIERTLAATAPPEVRWSLRAVRGLVVAEAVREAGSGDLVVVPAEALAGAGLEVAARARSHILGLRADVEVRRIVTVAGSEADVSEMAARLAAACGWPLERAEAAEVEKQGRAPGTVIAVRAADVPPGLRAGSRSLLLVRCSEAAPAAEDRERR